MRVRRESAITDGTIAGRWVWVCVCVYECMYVCVCVYVCMCVCVFVEAYQHSVGRWAWGGGRRRVHSFQRKKRNIKWKRERYLLMRYGTQTHTHIWNMSNENILVILCNSLFLMSSFSLSFIWINAFTSMRFYALFCHFLTLSSVGMAVHCGGRERERRKLSLSSFNHHLFPTEDEPVCPLSISLSTSLSHTHPFVISILFQPRSNSLSQYVAFDSLIFPTYTHLDTH